MRISIVTDKISSDPETAIELGVSWGIRQFELRGYYTDRAPCPDDLLEPRIMVDYNAAIAGVAGISPTGGPGAVQAPIDVEVR